MAADAAAEAIEEELGDRQEGDAEDGDDAGSGAED